MQTYSWKFDILGNFSQKMEEMTAATKGLEAEISGTKNKIKALFKDIAAYDWGIQGVRNISSGIQELGQSGVTLDSQMHDLSAVAGVVGEDLKTIEGYARESAKAFGTDASEAVTGYKLLLSQLSPELGKYPEALKAMGNSIQITSKLMGGDGVAAAEVLTTAMNQYGVSLEDPMKASEEMARMMNVMAAAGQAGSAELPAIKVALEQCGMAAKAAGVSFEETNAAIQVLDKAGKKGSEGGVALRNVMSTLAQGRFLPKDVQEELTAAGVDVTALGDKTKSLKERLDMLKPVMQDSALFSKLFGRENANAALALVGGTAALADFTDAVTGTTSAEEQAQIVMDSYAERQARVNQQIENLKIGFFQLTGDFTLWAGALGSVLVPLSQLVPLMSGIGSMMVWIKSLQWAQMWNGIGRMIYAARFQQAMINRELLTGQFVSNGFMINITRATLAVLRFGTVGIWNALKGIGALILAMLTGGSTSVAFATTASASFSTFSATAGTACRAVGVAIMNIPVIGWVVAAIAALTALGIYFWNTSAKFRGILKGLWEAFKAVFSGIAGMAKDVFGGIGDLLTACLNLDAKGIDAALKKIGGSFSNYGRQVGEAFNTAYEAETAGRQTAGGGKRRTVYKAKDGRVFNTLAEAKAHNEELKGTPQLPEKPGGGSGGAGAGSSASGSSSDTGGRIRSVTVNVGKLVERLEVHATTMSEGADRLREMVTEALLGALNDANLATA